MNMLQNIIASSMLAAIAISAPVQADELMDIIHPESADLFHFDRSLKASEPTSTFSLNDDYGNEVWSYEYEQYVNKADFRPENNIQSTQLVNRYLESNPTASGEQSVSVFKWDSVYDGYMLQ